MCGIIGYIGKKQALSVVFEGLNRMEYRGYDSAGVAICSGNQIFAEKAVGRISELGKKLEASSHIPGTLGIGHTRWATHGGVTYENAHPHTDCSKKIWVAHNGIIENYRELKHTLEQHGHVFSSETDTEVLGHLFEQEQAQMNCSFVEAVRLALGKVKGTYGIVTINATEPSTLVAARNFSPLLFGIGSDEYIVASDASAVLAHTRHIVYLDDGEMAVLTPDRHVVMDLKNNIHPKEPEFIEWSSEQAQKQGYPHFMLKEIHECPDAVSNSLRGRLMPEEGCAKLGGLGEVMDDLRIAEGIIISGCGTAYLAGRVGEYMLEECTGLPVDVDIASEFRYRKPVFRRRDIMIGISQSGETADTLAAMREAKEKGILTLGIVNVVGSTIARETNAGVYQHIGPEIGVASTKAFVSQLTILALLTILLGRQRDMSLVTGQRINAELLRIPELMGAVLAQEVRIRALAEKYAEYKNFFFLGRKYNVPTAYEGALKLKEVSYVHAEGYGAGELKHGPIAMIDKHFPSFCIVPQDSVYEKMISNIQEIKARGGPVIALATEGDEKIASIADDVIYIPKTLEMLTPLLAVIPLQLFAYYFGVLHGYDVDKPRNLAKSVTVE
ncbi:MAG: glutamine--fructose-6-phosphate transaminase (isomerizing) [Candidatus Sungbacteria bacterium]|nr:glutamine--fructose-6-phosphate transaminase (isomerizing) [bacterium]MDZ4260308.1 glutamine--fructose-6-phosphate transaminase (isomerizing) [Candidatus Sungbacteria bacterium]